MRITVIRNDPHVPPGHIERVVQERGHEFELVRLDEGDDLPDLGEVEALMVLGGEMGAYDEESFPYLVDEKVFLRAAVENDIPVLGVCLGCQLLAESLGGRAYLADGPELTLAPLPVEVDDDVVGFLAGGPTLTIHRDTWDLPPGGTLIARSDRYNQAFRFGSALGIQPHPEVDEAIVDSWMTTPSGKKVAKGAGTEASEVLTSFRSVADQVFLLADDFFGAWLAEVEQRQVSTAQR